MGGPVQYVKKESKTSDVDDRITNRYDIKRRLGKGAYGIVWKAVDNQTKDVVAVKKIFDAFRNQTDAQRTFREIMFLQAFKEHPNIIRLRGLHKATNNRDIYLIFDFMDTDLHHVIKKGTALKDVHKRYIMYQLFRATQYLHSGNVIHRDQKPSNVLINAECKIKIADFGLARSLTHTNEDDDGILTDYVATRWYRAPEILVASKKYTKGVDMWSLGCILGEMLLGKPLFPGSSTVNQMERILAVLPEPTSKEIFNMCSGYGKGLLEGYRGPKTSLKELVQSPCEDALNLLNKLLVFDPSRRLTASEALKHPFVSVYYNGRELILNQDVTPPLDDDVQLSVNDYRNKLYEMIADARVKKLTKQDLTPTRNYSEQIGSHQTDYHSKGEIKTNESSLRNRPKKSAAEELKEKYSSKFVLTKSETIHKNGCQRRIGASPHRSGMTQSRVPPGWPDKQRVLKAAQKPTQIKYRYDDVGGGDGPLTRSTNYLTNAQPPFRAALAQATALNSQLATLPKVAHKRDSGQMASSPSRNVTRYNARHGVLTASALQEIRTMLKH